METFQSLLFMNTETSTQTDSCLNVTVSCFANYTSPDNPKPVNLLQWLTSAKYRAQVEAIRAAPTKEDRDKLKAQLPAITPSGQFSRREEGALLKHSGLIQIDIDPKGNEHITNFNALKAQLCKMQNVAFAGDSASGTGFFLLIPIAHPEKHKAHFRALKADFGRLGITIDDKPQNVASLRGYSWDSEPYFNHNAKLYWKLEEEERQAETYRPAYSAPRPQCSDADRVEAVLQAQEGRKVDITASYSNWFAIGCALANAFGEAGREFFHRASQFHPEYTRQATDKQFDYCRRRSYRYSLGTFFRLAEDLGLRWKDSLQGEAAPQTKPRQAPKAIIPHSAPQRATDSELPPGFKIIEFEQGRTLEIDCLPAGWLNNEEHARAMKRLGAKGQLEVMKLLHPAVSQLVEVFGLQVSA